MSMLEEPNPSSDLTKATHRPSESHDNASGLCPGCRVSKPNSRLLSQKDTAPAPKLIFPSYHSTFESQMGYATGTCKSQLACLLQRQKRRIGVLHVDGEGSCVVSRQVEEPGQRMDVFKESYELLDGHCEGRSRFGRVSAE